MLTFDFVDKFSADIHEKCDLYGYRQIQIWYLIWYKFRYEMINIHLYEINLKKTFANNLKYKCVKQS